MSHNYSAIARQLAQIVGEKYVLTEPCDLACYECDAETFDVARPDLVVLPGSTEETAAIVQLAARHNIPVTARGAGTGLSGGATTIFGGISLVLSRLTKIISICPDSFVAHVQAGVTNLAVSHMAAPYGLYFAPDPSSQYASTIGGNIAENAGGAHTLKYGMTVHNVLGVRMVTAAGDTIQIGGAAGDSCGLDLLGLIVGSEGTVGIVTEAWLKLIPKAEAIETMLVYFPTLKAGGNAVSTIIAQGIIPCAMEMIDKLTMTCVEQSMSLGLDTTAGALLIIELDGPDIGLERIKNQVEAVVKEAGALSYIWAEDAEARARIWKARKTSFGSLGRIAPHGYVLDGVIPRGRLSVAIEAIEKIGQKYDVPIANVYHAGDGNLHPCLLYNKDDAEQVQKVLPAAREILLLCVELGGTLSGEHGIGIEKLAEMSLAFNEADLAAMSNVKEAFDAKGLLNPGKLLPSLRHCGESGRRPLLRHKLSSYC